LIARLTRKTIVLDMHIEFRHSRRNHVVPIFRRCTIIEHLEPKHKQ